MKSFWLGLLGSLAGMMLIAGMAYYQDIFTIDRDGTVYFRITTDGRVGMPNTPDATALLDLASTSKGFLMPRMTTAQRDVISTPATGLEVYNTTTNRAERYTGTAWKPVGISNVGARVFHSANQPVADSSFTPLAFNSERYDTDAIHDIASNNTRLTCKTAGKYHIFGNLVFSGSTTGRRIVILRLNGSVLIANQEIPPSSGGSSQLSLSTIYHMNVNDYVECVAYQTSGGSLDVGVYAEYSPEFGMTLLQE